MRSLCSLATAFLLATTLAVHAFVPYIDANGRILRWSLVTPDNRVHSNVVNRSTKAIRYFVASDLYSASNKTAELNAVRACFAQWQSVPGTILKFEEGGFAAPGIDINTADNTNAVFWAKNSTIVNGGFDDIRGLRAWTLQALTDDNVMLEADIVLNAVEFNWFTDFNDTDNPSAFIEAVLLHEIGHLIGLDHSPVGGATVVHSGNNGVDTEAGLSSDEIAAAHALYPQPSLPASLGYLQGRVTMNGSGILGAAVIAENSAGCVVAGTISRNGGFYVLLALPPGDYQIRVAPLDGANRPDNQSLLRGRDIAGDYQNAVTAFLPTDNRPITLNAGVTNTLDFNVVAGEPTFRISGIRQPSHAPSPDVVSRAAFAIPAGQSAFYVGVVSDTLPTFDGELTVTGDGITTGQTIYRPSALSDGRNMLMVPITVAPNATAGLRSLVVKRGSDIAYANGYLEILPSFPDFNFDGLDDRFQRRYFPLFTATEAAPDADPDGDGFSNRIEFNTGSDPTNRLSVNFNIDSVKTTSSGTMITWQSATGKRYQVYSRPDLPGSAWQAVGSPVTARGNTTQFTDTSALDAMKFYRVQLLQ